MLSTLVASEPAQPSCESHNCTARRDQTLLIATAIRLPVSITPRARLAVANMHMAVTTIEITRALAKRFIRCAATLAAPRLLLSTALAANAFPDLTRTHDRVASSTLRTGCV